MARFRVVRVTIDDGCFGYTAPPLEEVIADYLDRNQAKSIYKHYKRELARISDYAREVTSYSVQMLCEDGYWEDCSQYWMYREGEEFDAWVERKTGCEHAYYLLDMHPENMTWHKIIATVTGN